MFLFIIQLIYFIFGVVGFVVYYKKEDPIMLGASLFLLIAFNFFGTILNLNRIRDLEGTIEVYHDAYMKLVKKKK